jgi:hypothetical protein
MLWVTDEYDNIRPVLDDPNEGGSRVCEYDECQRPLPTEWPAVYCSTRCAMLDSGADEITLSQRNVWT